LEARDARDMSRSVAPLKPAQDALQLDNFLDHRSLGGTGDGLVAKPAGFRLIDRS